SSFFEGLKAADGVVQARGGVEEIVRSRSQNKGKRECTGSLRGCGNPFDSQVKIIKGTVRVASRVLNRAPNQAHLARKPDRFRHDFRRVAKPLFQIRRDGQIRSAVITWPSELKPLTARPKRSEVGESCSQPHSVHRATEIHTGAKAGAVSAT